MRPGAFIGPVIVIAIGVLFLLNNIGWGIPVHDLLRNGWPFILIAVGLLQLLGVLAGRGSLPGGLILITIGTLFAFERMAGLSFRYTWPLILIVVGGIGLMRALMGPAYFAGRAARRFRGGFSR
jgi:hypothetical protein